VSSVNSEHLRTCGEQPRSRCPSNLRGFSLNTTPRLCVPPRWTNRYIARLAGVIRDAGTSLCTRTMGAAHIVPRRSVQAKPTEVAGGTWTEVVLRSSQVLRVTELTRVVNSSCLNGALYGTTSAGGVNVTNNFAGRLRSSFGTLIFRSS